jgi:hypothetical protein
LGLTAGGAAAGSSPLFPGQAYRHPNRSALCCHRQSVHQSDMKVDLTPRSPAHFPLLSEGIQQVDQQRQGERQG